MMIFMKKIKIKNFHGMVTEKRFKYFSNRNKFDFVRTANRENKKKNKIFFMIPMFMIYFMKMETNTMDDKKVYILDHHK